jgi:hypothetical protein
MDWKRVRSWAPDWNDNMRAGIRTELDKVTNSAHDQEADANGLGDLDELAAISYEGKLASS